MQDNEKMDKLTERVIKLEERAKSNTNRLNEHDKKLENIHDLTVAVKEVAMETRATREDVNDMNSRLKNIEEKPAKKWENATATIITRNYNGNFRLFLGKIRFVGEGRTSYEESVERCQIIRYNNYDYRISSITASTKY